MNEQRTIKVFIVHQWVMAELHEEIIKDLQSHPFCTFVDLSFPVSKPIPPDQEDFIQDIVCGTMMESDIVIVLPDTREGSECLDEEDDYLSDFIDPFRRNRGLHPGSTYAVEMKTLMFDAADTKPVLVLGWTKDSADHLVNKLRNPRIGNRAYDPDRFHAMGLDERKEPHAIAEKIIAILDDHDEPS